jgi:hypothetical protein
VFPKSRKKNVQTGRLDQSPAAGVAPRGGGIFGIPDCQEEPEAAKSLETGLAGRLAGPKGPIYLGGPPAQGHAVVGRLIYPSAYFKAGAWKNKKTPGGTGILQVPSIGWKPVPPKLKFFMA